MKNQKQVMESVYKWVLTNTLILFNVLVKVIEEGTVFSMNAVKAVKNSYIPDIYIFRERNSVPWVVKKGSVYMCVGCALEYSLSDKMFYPESTSQEAGAAARMDDIVMAELVDLSGAGICDMSEFFHAVRWSGGDCSPSLYEMVLVNLLTNNKIVSDEVLSKYVLNVITIDNPSLTVQLSSEAAKKPFLGWNVCHPVAPAAPVAPVMNEASI